MPSYLARCTLGVADEPGRKDPDGDPWRVRLARYIPDDWRRSKTERAIFRPATLLAQLRLQEGSKARLFNGAESRPLRIPFIEAAHDDGARRQVHHRARSEGSDDLAQALGCAGHERSCAPTISRPSGSRTLR